MDPLPQRLLEQSRVIAVLGAHTDAQRAAHYVPAYLAAQGYEVWPVNPRLVGVPLFGRATLASLTEIPVPVDLVDVFRRSDAVAGHLDEILAMTPRPHAVWLQLGIVDDAFAQRLRAEGIDVVQDRCTLADHRRLGLGPRPA